MPRTGLAGDTAHIYAMALDDAGDIVIGGDYDGRLVFGGEAPETANPEERNAFLVKLSPP